MKGRETNIGKANSLAFGTYWLCEYVLAMLYSVGGKSKMLGEKGASFNWKPQPCGLTYLLASKHTPWQGIDRVLFACLFYLPFQGGSCHLA